MRKILLALFALALVVAFTAPSYAADFKMTGFYRVRGSSEAVEGDDGDKDRYLDALIRPRFTVKAGAVTSVWEPEFVSANGGFAIGPGRQTVGVNRWVIDFAVPGSALRIRMGRSDYFSPDKEIYDSGGRHREPGIALYGKLSKNISLSAFMTSAREDAGPNNDDKTDYYVSLGVKVSPTLTLSPWVANSRDAATGGYDYSYLGLHAKTKVGILSVNASGVIVEGDLSSGDELSGWAVLVRTSTSLGKLKLSGNLTMLSGNDGTKAGEDGRFRTPQEGGSGWFVGGHIMSSRRWTSLGNNIRSVHLGALNGATVIEGLVDYKVSKTLTLGGGVSLYNAAEPSLAANTMDAKEFGTELNAGFKWKIHPTLELRGVGAVIVRGDYGRVIGDPEADDGWAVGWTLRHIF
ncbi:MAG: hypothetical protein OXL41_07990 [Nitrospinae bacterium]|nr:hypothetical protein [Nitrospinota bacterium]